MSECRRSTPLQVNQIRGLQLALLQRIMKTPVAECNLVPLLAALRDIQLLSTAARDCIVDDFLQRLRNLDDSIVPDLPILFHHLLQLGDAKAIAPVIQLWLSRGKLL